MLKLKNLVLSELFFSNGVAYEKEIGPNGVIKSKEVPTEDLKSISEEDEI